MPKKGTLKHDFHRIVQALERRNEFHPLAEKFLGWMAGLMRFLHSILGVQVLRKIQPSLLKITAATVSWNGPADMPEGCWQKGSTTTLLSDAWLQLCWQPLSCIFMAGRPFRQQSEEWLQWQMEQVDWSIQLQDDPRNVTIYMVLVSINTVFQKLYRNGVWMPAAESQEVGALGIRALQGYSKLASACLQKGQPRYPLYPKFHLLLHQFWWLQWKAKEVSWVENPMCDNCQIDESFIGVISRFSRRVSPKMTIDRTLDMYLMSLRKCWEKKCALVV